jgi:hypothetical protein
MHYTRLAVPLVCLLFSGAAFSQGNSREARFPDKVIYQSFLNTVERLAMFESKLPPDPNRKHPLKGYYYSVKLTDEEWAKVFASTAKAQERLKANNKDSAAFLSSVRKTGDIAPTEMPPAHRVKINQLDSDREKVFLGLKEDLKQALGASFARFDQHLSDRASSKIQRIIYSHELDTRK